MWRTKVTLIYKRMKNLRAVQLLLGHSKLESTVRYLGIVVDDALEISEQTEIESAPCSRMGECRAATFWHHVERVLPARQTTLLVGGPTKCGLMPPSETSLTVSVRSSLRSGIKTYWALGLRHIQIT